MADRRAVGRVRICDIAREAGVSPATVSNVLSGRRQIDSQAGRRVLDIAGRMGYERKAAPPARRAIRFVLYRKHGLVVMDTPFFSELIAGIEKACRARNYELIMNYMSPEDAPLRAPGDECAAVLLLATEMDGRELAGFTACHVPVLVLDNHMEGAPMESVAIDNVAAGALAVRHLLGNGHRRIGLIRSSVDFNNMAQRESGWRLALDEAGLPSCQEDVYSVEPTMEGAHRDMKRLINTRGLPRVTAFFAGNDIMAVGAARALKEAGIRLPEDISLVGMDDMPVCRAVEPPLTTLRVDKNALGALAVERLIDMTEHGLGAPRKTLLGVTLIRRESVKCLQAMDGARG